MDKNLVIRPFKYEKLDFLVYFDVSLEMLFIERKVIQQIIKKPYKYISKVVTQLLTCEFIHMNEDIKKLKIDNKIIFLYDLTILREFFNNKLYESLVNLNDTLINEYNNDNTTYMKKELSDNEKRKYYNKIIYYNNDLYDSETFINSFILRAKEEIIIISKFMNDEIFDLLKPASTKIILYTSSNALITRFNTSIFVMNHNLTINRTYKGSETYIIIDDIIYLFDVSIINILKENSMCVKSPYTKEKLFKKLKI